MFGYIKAALKGFLEMKVLIAYSTHTGCCADCAEILGQALANYEVDIADLSEREPNPEDYDIIVVGSGIKRRKFYRETADFIKKYTNIVGEKYDGHIYDYYGSDIQGNDYVTLWV